MSCLHYPEDVKLQFLVKLKSKINIKKQNKSS